MRICAFFKKIYAVSCIIEILLVYLKYKNQL